MRQDVSKFWGLMSVFAICAFGLTAERSVVAACSELDFDNPTMFASGMQTHKLVTGDLNGDGHTDLAAANEGSGTITIRFGDGSGGFAMATQFASPSPTSMAIADFNGDGIPDLVISNRTLNAISVRMGVGGGSFRPASQIAVGPAPSGLVIADFNADGKMDVATSNGGSSTISVLMGSGTGSFSAANTLTIPGVSGLAGIVSADFNADGDQDLATLNRGSLNISVLFGNGNGGFSAGGTYPSGGNQPSGITARDLNNDGKADIVTVNAASHNVIARFNDGNGVLAASVTLATGIEPFAVAAGDLDNDGQMDIVTTNRRSRSLSAFRGTGRGTFAARKDFPLNAGPRALAIADFNNNGMADLATGIETGNIAVLLNRCSPNSAPTISSETVTRQQDSGSSVLAIGTIDDDLDDPVNLAVTVNGGASATVNGVTISNIAVNGDGVITAEVSASCGAMDALFVLGVVDSGGLSATTALGVDVTSETTAPTINNGYPLPNITVYLPQSSSSVSMPVNFELPIATDNCTVSPAVVASPASGSTFNMGSTIVVVSATDEVGNVSTATFRVNVLFNFGGFLSPVDPFPAINSVNAGSSIPLKFSLGGYRGMNILAPGYPASSQVACNATVPSGTMEETVSNDGGLQYDAASDQYKYVWKTKKLWRQSCRILVLRLADGSEHYARFSFR